MSAGEKIHNKRLEKRLSFQRLAKESGVSISTIYRVENEISRPNMTTLKAIAEVLETTPSELMND